MPTPGITGRTVLLTGGLGSLGQAQAEAFLASGAHLLLLDRPDHAGAGEILARLRTVVGGEPVNPRPRTASGPW